MPHITNSYSRQESQQPPDKNTLLPEIVLGASGDELYKVCMIISTPLRISNLWYLQIAREYQAQLQHVTDSRDELKRKLHDISNQSSQPNKHRRVHTTTVSNDGNSSESDDEQPSVKEKRLKVKTSIRVCGRQFVFMRMLWIRNSNITFNNIAVDENFDPSTRFNNSDTAMEGQLHEVLDVIPARFHDAFLEHESWMQFEVNLSNFFVI